jgi:hypothetical protein
MVLADGARVDAFERLLQAGELPEIQRHVVERGAYRRGTSVFTSTTGPAHIPFLTGCYPGTANVPGYRWFDRRSYVPGLPMGPWCLRSYNGPEAWLYVRDLEARTLFELTDNALNVFGVITRGARNVAGRLKSPLWLWSHYAHDYRTPDRVTAWAMERALGIRSEFRFVVFPGIDWSSHYVDLDGELAMEAYRTVDRAVGAAAERLRRDGAYEDTLIVVCSDHGHHPVHTHFDLAPELERHWGITIAYHSGRVWRRSPAAVVCVSGNGMSHVYFRGGEVPREVVDWLLLEPAVDVLATRDGDGLRVESRRGRALLAERDGKVEYRPLEGDPFGFAAVPERMTHEEALERTFETAYPDALVQLVQLLRSPRTGDLIVSATPGFDLRFRYESPEHRSSHGALYRQHMLVPLALSAPLDARPMRTADVFATVLDWLGRDPPAGIDGVSRLARG